MTAVPGHDIFGDVVAAVRHLLDGQVSGRVVISLVSTSQQTEASRRPL